MARRESTCISSGLLDADTAVLANKGKVCGITLIQAEAACYVIVYDNASAASGTVLAKVAMNTNAASTSVMFSIPIVASNGIYVDVDGAGANFIVHYVNQEWRTA